jgi:hypothetical protein
MISHYVVPRYKPAFERTRRISSSLTLAASSAQYPLRLLRFVAFFAFIPAFAWHGLRPFIAGKAKGKRKKREEPQKDANRFDTGWMHESVSSIKQIAS